MIKLYSKDPGFAEAFEKIVGDRRESDAGVTQVVLSVLADVRARGDVALAEYTAKFDSHTLETPDDWRISAQDCKAAFDALHPTLRDALETAAKRIAAYHAAQKPENRDYVDETGVRLGAVWRPHPS